MSPKKHNDSAVDLWRQVLAHLSRQENAAIWQPDHDSSEDEEKLKEDMKSAGWS
jgi:hypothetical protein